MTDAEEMEPVIAATLGELIEVKLAYMSTTVEELIIDFAFDQKISLQFDADEKAYPGNGTWDTKSDSFILLPNWSPYTFFCLLGCRKLSQLQEVTGTKRDDLADQNFFNAFASSLCNAFQPDTAIGEVKKKTSLEYFDHLLNLAKIKASAK